MLAKEYFHKLQQVLDQVAATQLEEISKAGAAIAQRLASGSAWHVLDTGHMLMHEGVGRTGGMMALKPIVITSDIQNPVRYRPGVNRGSVGYDSVPGFADYVIGRSKIMSGDVVMIGSVSGYNYFPVDFALKLREIDCLTIAITSVAYSSRLVSKHPSGLRLFEACDHCLDNCAAYGDAMVDVPALQKSICPSSGIGASAILWALQCCIVENMLDMGLEPGVYLSNHLPGAAEINGRLLLQYEQLGY